MSVAPAYPLAVETGRQVTSIADVVRLAIETGQGHLLGLPPEIVERYKQELDAVVVVDAVHELEAW